MSNASKTWTEFYNHATDISYPAEGVIRILKGTTPNNKMPKPLRGKSICDIGFGDGRHFQLFDSLGLESFGVEVSSEICSSVGANLIKNGVSALLKIGDCSRIPFPDGAFHYALAWNSCYYMSTGTGDFRDHVSEMARILVPGGWLVCSVPKRECFIYDDSTEMSKGYRTINSEFFGLRQNEIMRCFANKEEIEEEFSSHFRNFSFADIDMKWFGLNYNWHVFTAST